MSLTTQERLSNRQEMYPPRIIEIFDTGATDTQKVPQLSPIYLPV